jgi:hypothetical protein
MFTDTHIFYADALVVASSVRDGNAKDGKGFEIFSSQSTDFPGHNFKDNSGSASIVNLTIMIKYVVIRIYFRNSDKKKTLLGSAASIANPNAVNSVIFCSNSSHSRNIVMHIYVRVMLL